jgi:uncharacterized membrane-anchored protein
MHKQSHNTKKGSRIALLLILGSSPMIEGIPAFFAAGQYGLWLLIIMALVFAAATISTYILFSVYSPKGLKQVRFGRFEPYGEIVSGAVIALVGPASTYSMLPVGVSSGQAISLATVYHPRFDPWLLAPARLRSHFASCLRIDSNSCRRSSLIFG